MREILFRGKGNPKYNDGMWYEGYLTYDGEDYQILEPEYGTCKRTVIAETIGEFTGLKDKNGRRIFEGDIVKVLSSDTVGEMHETTTVVDDIRTSSIIGWLEYANELEIIGNIYDNPELLKGE